MRYLLIIIILTLSTLMQAQVKGDRNIITETYETEDILKIEVGLYADVKVDMSAPNNYIKLTADANIINLIGRDIDSGRLVLDQKEWIKASRDIIIEIGAPSLTFIQQGTHDKLLVENINTDELSVSALIGSIELIGQVNRLNAAGESGDIDARNLTAEIVDINLWDSGKISLAQPKVLQGIVKVEGLVYYDDNDTQLSIKTESDGQVKERSMTRVEPKVVNPEARFIDFKLKNNSNKRINAYVRGPKPNGKYFSYGFPMRPGQVRKERWTVGTKVFRSNALGLRKELVEITADDEGEIVRLYGKE